MEFDLSIYDRNTVTGALTLPNINISYTDTHNLQIVP